MSLVFPDQYGRLTGLKLNAEYFLEVIEPSSANSKPHFDFKFNPFRFDVLGKMMKFKDQFSIPKSLVLRPDMLTLREMAWQKNEALVMADVLDPETEEVLPYAPRNLLKETLAKLDVKGIDS